MGGGGFLELFVPDAYVPGLGPFSNFAVFMKRGGGGSWEMAVVEVGVVVLTVARLKSGV